MDTIDKSIKSQDLNIHDQEFSKEKYTSVFLNFYID